MTRKKSDVSKPGEQSAGEPAPEYEIDWEYGVLLIAQQFGWTLDYIFSLSWPVFYELTLRIMQLQNERARSEVFPGVTAALCGGEAARTLDKGTGCLVKEKNYAVEYTEEDLQRAMEISKRVAAKFKQEKAERQKNGV